MKEFESLYLHIPFCNEICSYCDFCKMYYNKKFVLEYLEALDREIFDLYKGEKLETIYIGGGTPSSLDINELELLFKINYNLILLYKISETSNALTAFFFSYYDTSSYFTEKD